MEYRMLGRLDVLDQGDSVDIGPRQQRALLALLLVNANHVVSTERIVEALWPDDPLGKEKTLWVYISRLRTALEPDREPHAKSSVIITRDHGYSLVVDPDSIDAHRFEQCAARGRTLVRDDPATAVKELSEALTLWAGAPLEDFAYDEFAQSFAHRLTELHLGAREDLLDAELRLGHHRDVVGELEALVDEHSLRERPIGLLMVALYRSGRQAEALRAFERYRRTIGDELGIEPSPELRRIEEQVLLHDARLDTTLAEPRAFDPTLANPFKGLQAFAEADVATFFGRDRLVTDLLRRLSAGTRLLALVGASGSGKSSVVRAGLIPALRKGAIEGSEQWLIAQMVPGGRPFIELEAALLRSTLDAPDSLSDVLDDPEEGLLRSALRLLPDRSARLVLVIDQFEELFTLVDSEADRARFIANLETALADPHERVILVVALRADFYGRPLEYPRFAELLGTGVVNTVPLTPDELEAAAEEPAALAGVRLEPTLLARLLGDVAGQSGGLPLFQYALTELFERRTGDMLTAKAYEEMGGVRGALGRRAEELYGSLDLDEQQAAQQLFLRLVAISEAGAWSRRRVPGSQVASIDADVVALQTVVERFGQHRLLTFDRDHVSGSPTVEVAHEALLHEWDRLRRWIEEGQDDVLRHARFVGALHEWQAADARTDYLLTGDRLADYERWADVSTLRLTAGERSFLDASVAHREELLAEERARQERESTLDRKARTRLRGLVGTGAALAVAAIVVAWIVLTGGSPQIAVVHGPAGDLGVNDLMAAGLITAEGKSDISIEGVTVLVDPVETLQELADSGADLIVTSGTLDTAVEEVAPNYPDVAFVAIDPVALHVELDNLTEIHFSVEQSAFLAGAAAARATETGKVGFIGGMQIFPTERSRVGFEEGAVFRGDDVEVESRYLGPIELPRFRITERDDLAYEVASAMYAGGVDIIFHDAGPAGAGVLRAARELSTPDRHLWVIGSDVNEWLVAPSAADRQHILSSALKRYDSAVVEAVRAFLDGDLVPGETYLGIDVEAVALARDGGHLDPWAGPLAVLEGDMVGLHEEASIHATRSPRWQYQAEAVVALTLTDEGCTATVSAGPSLDGDRLRLPRGTVVLFEFANATDLVGGVSLRTVPSGSSIEELQAEALAGIPDSYDAMLAISLVEPGGRTSSAAIVTGDAFVPNCIWYEREELPADVPALIVSPSI